VQIYRDISLGTHRHNDLFHKPAFENGEEMTQTEEKIENFANSVGVDLSHQFEKQVSRTIKELMDSLESHLIDDNTKVDYATHVFAKALDDMVDYLETPKLLN